MFVQFFECSLAVEIVGSTGNSVRRGVLDGSFAEGMMDLSVGLGEAAVYFWISDVGSVDAVVQ